MAAWPSRYGNRAMNFSRAVCCQTRGLPISALTLGEVRPWVRCVQPPAGSRRLYLKLAAVQDPASGALTHCAWYIASGPTPM